LIRSINEVFSAPSSRPYFIADIAANHDGELSRAIDLIKRAADAGADAAKFQHFTAAGLVSDFGFKSLGRQQSHQASWTKSVFEVYEDASINQEWTQALAEASKEAGIRFMSTPYSIELANLIDPFVEAYKIGSGDLNYHELLAHIAASGKPWILATGASTLEEVAASINVLSTNTSGVIMQCNTNYTADDSNFKYINLNVLSTYSNMFPGLVLGLSDHTLGHSTVLGAQAFGARVFEKHFTDDNDRNGPDHKFSMNPETWRAMVLASGELHESLGDGIKRVEENEIETVVLQRRSIRASKSLIAGQILTREMVEVLRPAPKGSIGPQHLESVIGKKLLVDRHLGENILWDDLAH
jgi:N-acetylneuraminate synthase